MDLDERGVGPGAALLLVIGEPFSEDHKTQILAEITKGFRCWDCEETGFDINEVLAHIANRASLGEEGLNGERIIQHLSENLAVEILINPQTQSVKNAVKKLLVSPPPVKYIIHAGHAFQDTGAWVLQDDTFEFKHLSQVFKNSDVENALKQNMEASLTIHTVAENNWGKSISKADFTNMVRIQLNPPEKQENIHGILQFTAYVGSFIKVVPLTSLLQASEQFGNISFSRPTLYIFPGCQGDSALFGVSGFNLLVNGGYNRRACFWDFARHLDRVDAMLLTHLGSDNIFSINTVLQRKSLDNIHPQIGYLYMNVPEKLLQARAGNSSEKGSDDTKDPSLLINLATEGTKLTQMAIQAGIAPHPCCRDDKAKTTEPINLYHKLGHGSLDMYALNPISDSKELKEFYQNWTKQSANMGTNGPFPLQSALSVCTLLVWKPYNLNEKIVRIFFPGNAPQHKIAEGLEKMKTFDFLKYASCTGKDLLKPVTVKKVRPGSSATSARTSSRTTSARSDSQRKTESTRGARTETKPSATSPVKSSRSVNSDDVTKRLSKPKEVKERETKTRPSSATTSTTKSSASKKTTTGTTTSPRKSPSHSKSPSPPKTSPVKTAPSASLKSPQKIASPKEQTPEPVLKTSNGLADNVEEIPAAVPEPLLNNLSSDISQAPASLPEQKDSMQAMNNGVNSPKEAWVNDIGGNSLSSAADPKARMFSDNGFGFDNEGEEIKPQALPDPPIVGQGHEMTDGFNTDLGFDNEKSEQKSPLSSFVFTNDEPGLNYSSDHTPIEQNIQYGISNGRSRAMGGIEEVDEEEVEDRLSETSFGNEDDKYEGHAFDKNYSKDEEIDTYKKADNSLENNHEELQKDETESLEKYCKSTENLDQTNASFDPLSEWGQPMGLPSPPPLDSKRSATSPQKSSLRTVTDSKTSRTTTSRTGTASSRSSTTRPASGATSKRPMSSRSSPPSAKIPPLPPVTPFYVDLTYIPNHGDTAYCDIEFFKRVRARYYVLSSLAPNPKVLDSLVDAKPSWEQDDLEITIIPTYDNDTLRHWVGLNKDRLQELHVDLTPAVSRCTIQLQDLETSLPAYRLEV